MKVQEHTRQITGSQTCKYKKVIKNLEYEIKRQNFIIKSLHETTIGLMNHRRSDDLLKDILKRAAQVARTPHGYIYLIDEQNETLEMKIGVGMYEASRVYHLRKGEGFGGRIWAAGKPMALADYESWPHRLPGDQWNLTHAIIGTPLKSNRQVVGVIVLSNSAPDRPFSAEVLVELGKFAELASVVFQNTRLYESLERELAERRRAEAELYLSTARLRAVIESAKDYIYVKDQALRYKDVNPAMLDLFNKPIHEMIGKTDYDLFDAETAALLEGLDRQFLAGINTDDTELHLVINEKKIILNRIRVPLREKNGTIIGICGIVRDITEWKRAEEEISQARMAVDKAQRMASLGAMAAGIAHEINQPLNSIKVNASGLLYLYSKGEIHEFNEIMADIRDICDNTDRICEIISHMRLFIQNRNRQEITPLKPCNIVKAVKLAKNIISTQIKYYGISVVDEIKISELYVNATMTGLEGIIVNILLNAVEALKTTDRNDKKITIKLFVRSRFSYLEIEDNGPGINTEDKANIFSPFFTTKNGDENMGLGLTIIDTFVRSFDGKIYISDGRESGTKITVELPLCRDLVGQGSARN